MKSPKLCKFLAWTVQETLRNNGATIKQYVVGREVFDRRDDFDPGSNSIVRTEAQRLRRKLREYYESDGVSDPVLIAFVSGSYVPAFQRRKIALPVRERQAPVVAVLPFENLSDNPDLGYFCRGVADSIQQRLARARGWKVIATSSAFCFGAGENNSALVASRLGVTAIVQGSIRQLSERIRIHAQVVDLASETCIWAEVFDRQTPDIFAIEDEIAFSVADALTVQLLAGNDSSTAKTPSLDAYALYLHGRDHWNEISIDGCEKAIDCFTRAVLLFPEYADAYAALSEAYLWMLFAARELIEAARSAALRALQFDSQSVAAHLTLASLGAAMEWRWEEAEALFRRTLELNPNYLLGYLQRGYCRWQSGDVEGSRSDYEMSVSLDPLSVRCRRGGVMFFYLTRNYAQAMSLLNSALEMAPENRHTRYFGGLLLMQMGRYGEAISALLESIEDFAPGLHVGALIAAYAAAGCDREANETLQALQQKASRSFVSPVAFVHAYAGMTRKPEALDWLEKAAEQRYTGLMHLRLDPLFDNLRSESRFRAVLRRMNLPDA